MALPAFRPYDPERDEPEAYALWQAALGSHWPVSRRTFHRVTVGSGVYEPGDHLVAQEGDRVIGFAGTQTRRVPGDERPRGSILLIMVEPSRQRQGIGRALLEQALGVLQQRGVIRAQLGGGGVGYFWPGVPANLPGGWEFFEACGWPYVEPSYDLVRTLGDYRTPPGIEERVREQRVTLEMAAPADAPAILEFERRCFPGWLHAFEHVADHGEYDDILFARDGRGEILGTTLVMDPRSRWRQDAFVWSELLGENTGGVGPLGVQEEARGRGIGLALAARVTRLLKQRGVATSYIGWTWLVDWYGKLSYHVWQEYRMSWKQL
jgi:beta-N-acetylhexosaminidase